MGFWEWIAKHALDGIAAGLVGGLVTGGAVWATIRHERTIRLQDRRDSELEALRRAVVEMLEGATSLRHAALGTAELRGPAARFLVQLILLESLASSHPKELLALECRRNRIALMGATSADGGVRPKDVVEVCEDLVKIAAGWIFATPDAAAAAKRAESFLW